jgi:hypothetical protein
VVNQLGDGILFYDTTFFFGQDLLLDEDHDTDVATSTPPLFDCLFDILEKQKTSIEQILHNQDEIMVNACCLTNRCVVEACMC